MILYHNTTNDNAIKISKQGLKCDKGEEYRSGFKEYEGNLIWATNNPIKGYGNCTISFEISDEEASKYKVNDTQYAIPRDISPSDIIDINWAAWNNNGNTYQMSDIIDLARKFGKNKVYKVLINHGNLIPPITIDDILDMIDKVDSITESEIINLSKLSYSLNEARIGQLIGKTKSQTPKLADRADFVSTDYIGISKFGILNFRTTSQTNKGKYWYQTIEIPDLQAKLIDENITSDLMKRLIEQDDIKVFCSCPAFLYWSFKYMGWTRDYGIEPETRAPKRNNVRLQGALCKHLLSITDLLTEGKLYEQIASDANNWMKYMQGDSYKNFHKARLMGDANKRKNQINWENYDSYMNDYFASQADKNKFLDDEDIKNSLKAEIERTAKTNPNMTLDDFITDEFSVDGVNGLAKELQIDPEYVKRYFKNIGW